MIHSYVLLALAFGYLGFLAGRLFELRFEGKELRYLDLLNRTLVAHSGDIEAEMLQYSNALHEIDSVLDGTEEAGSSNVSTTLIRQLVRHGLD